MSAPNEGDGDELQSMIEASSERLFADLVTPEVHALAARGGWPGALWAVLAEAGLPHAMAAEADGGAAARWAQAAPILRGIGRWQLPLPLAETLIASLLLSRAGAVLPGGPVTLLAGPPRALRLHAAGPRPGAGWCVSGELDRVPWARQSPLALLLAEEGRAGRRRLALLRLAGQAGATIDAGANLAGEPRERVRLDAVALELVADDPLPELADDDAPLMLLGALARSEMIAGAGERVLEMSLQYARERVQFGRAIGDFQAVQHALAGLAGELASAAIASRVALLAAPGLAHPAADSLAFDVAVAKVRAGEAASRACAVAHQVHGAIGTTALHPLHRATQRLWSWRAEYGSDTWWAQRLGERAIGGGGAGFWPGLTQRRLGQG